MSTERTFAKVLIGLLLVSVLRVAESQVSQPLSVVSSEGASVILPCNHSVSNGYSFFWYKQILGSAPHLIISGSKAMQKERYNMTYTRFSSSLVIHQVQREDAAVYYCVVTDTVTETVGDAEPKPLNSISLWSRSQNKVEQSPRLLTVKAGEDSTFKCSYKITPFNNLQWFKQSPGKGLVFLTFTRYSDETKSNGRFKATINATSEEGYLHITSSQSKDSATYFCVASAQCF